MELVAGGVVMMNESRTGNRLRGFNAGMALLHSFYCWGQLAVVVGTTLLLGDSRSGTCLV